MKGGQNFRDLQQKKKEVEDAEWVVSQPCLVCGKTGLKGAYGHHGTGWTCSAACEVVEVAKPKYPGHEAADFEKLHNL